MFILIFISFSVDHRTNFKSPKGYLLCILAKQHSYQWIKVKKVEGRKWILFLVDYSKFAIIQFMEEQKFSAY